jgi:hypothetical protein
MTEFHAEIRARVQEAVASLEAARRSGDDYMVEVRLGELEGLAHLVAEHGLYVPELSRYVDMERTAS